MDVQVLRKEYSYSVGPDNVDKDFKKDIIIENIILFFYLDERNYVNTKEIKKELDKIFESAIEDVKYDVERTKSNKKVADSEIKEN